MRTRRLATGAPVALVTLLLVLTSLTGLTGTASARSSGSTPVQRLRNARIPASCTHPAARLNGFHRSFGRHGSAQLLVKQAVTARLGGPSGSLTREAIVVPLDCNAGGVGWPQLVMVYGMQGRLLGWVDLGKVRQAQEHETVTEMTQAGAQLQVMYFGTDGCCFSRTTNRGVLGWRNGHVTWHSPSPLTVDFAAGLKHRTPPGPGLVTKPSDAAVWLTPAPRPFRHFIKHRWVRLHNAAGSCSSVVVSVSRYSHKGFASGAEVACGGAAYVWGRDHGRWRPILGFQDVTRCGEPGSLRRQAFTALAVQCLNAQGKVVRLGHWPQSGQ